MKRRNPTIIDVARVAGTSKSVVSRVVTGKGSVSQQLRARVEAAMESLGYRANPLGRSLVSGRTGAVGVLLRNAQSDFYSTLFTDLQTHASGDEIRLVGATGNMVEGSETIALEGLLDLGVDAVVIGSGSLDVSAIASIARRVPVVAVSRQAVGTAASAVFDDPEAHARLALDELWQHGHRDIALVDFDSPSALLRIEALRRYANELGLRMTTVHGGFDLEPGQRAAADWLAGERRESALVTLSYDAAVGAMHQLSSAGLSVPGDVSVVAVDAFHTANPFLPDVSGTRRDHAEFSALVWDEVMRRTVAAESEPRDITSAVAWHAGVTLGDAR